MLARVSSEARVLYAEPHTEAHPPAHLSVKMSRSHRAVVEYVGGGGGGTGLHSVRPVVPVDAAAAESGVECQRVGMTCLPVISSGSCSFYAMALERQRDIQLKKEATLELLPCGTQRELKKRNMRAHD